MPYDLKYIILFYQAEYLSTYELNILHNSSKGTYTEDPLKAPLVNGLKEAYINTPKHLRGDSLVPYAVDTLHTPAVKRNKTSTYSFNYRWNNDTRKVHAEFLEDKFDLNTVIKEGTLLDRLGSPRGTYLSPLQTGNIPFSIRSRALPYFFIEKNIVDEPSYHLYKATSDISIPILQNKLKESTNPFIMDNYNWLYRQLHRTNIVSGTIAPVAAFGKQGIGMGFQYLFPVSIQTLMDLGVLEEVQDHV